MGILASYLQNAMSQGPTPPTPFGAPSPPNPLGGGSPLGQPGAWPSGVPNPLGLPSPGDAWNTLSGWFSNPYGGHGSTPNPSPYNGVNPYGTQVSGGNTNPWDPSSTGATYRPPDPNALQSGWTFSAPEAARPPNPNGTGDVAGAYTQQMGNAGVKGFRAPPTLTAAPPPVETGGHFGGGMGTGPLGQQWLYQMNNRGPWQHVQPGSPYYGKGYT